MFKIFRLNSKGSAAVLLSFAIAGLLGFTAMVVDIGVVYTERTRLSNAIDSATLAAALEINNGENQVRAVAIEYLEKNNINPNDVEIIIGHNSVEIKGKKNVKHFFAPVIGIKDSDVTGRAQAIMGPVGSVRGGVRPFAVEYYPYEYGDVVTLKAGAGSGYNGNYLAIALGQGGASTWEDNVLKGYTGTLSVGDWIPTQTGNMAGASNRINNHINTENSTFDNFERDTIRVWTIPLVSTLELNGKTEIQVLGFGQFYVEGSQAIAGKLEITGRFIRNVTSGIIDMNAQDTGTYAVKLSK